MSDWTPRAGDNGWTSRVGKSGWRLNAGESGYIEWEDVAGDTEREGVSVWTISDMTPSMRTLSEMVPELWRRQVQW